MQAIIFADSALKSEEIFGFNPNEPFNWREYYDKIETAEIHELVERCNKIH